MTNAPLPRIVSLSVRIYQWLLGMGPAGFRREYGLPMIQVFRQRCLDAYRQQGTYGVICLWLPMFGEAIGGMLAEHFTINELALHERVFRMLRTQRRSMIAIFCAFVAFGLAWLFFFRMDDPLSEWNAIVRPHPEVDIIYEVILLAGFVAFLMVLAFGLPIIFAAIKQAFANRRRDVLVLFSLAAFMLAVFAVVTTLVIFGLWSFDPNGGVYALISLVVLLVVTVTVARAVTRSEPSERVLRFALLPATGVTVAMVVALVATLIEAWLLSVDAPHTFSGTVTPNWVIGDVMMAVARCIALIALWRGFRARRPTLA